MRITAMKIALVTGASSGLGREFVRQIAEQGKVEEIWAVSYTHLTLPTKRIV